MQHPGLASHILEIEHCKQRGGRFLSIMDLLEAGTLSLDLAAFLGARILQGQSFMVGAEPGGAGKTTVMGALLNFVPPALALKPATPGVPGEALSSHDTPACFICHEIGRGHYYAYLWGKDIQDFFALPHQSPHMAATNLHADDMAQAREIVCKGCGVSEDLFDRWPLFIFLELTGRFGSIKRRIESVWKGGRRKLWQSNRHGWDYVDKDDEGNADLIQQVRDLLRQLKARNRRTIEEVRQAVLDHFKSV